MSICTSLGKNSEPAKIVWGSINYEGLLLNVKCNAPNYIKTTVFCLNLINVPLHTALKSHPRMISFPLGISSKH